MWILITTAKSRNYVYNNHWKFNFGQFIRFHANTYKENLVKINIKKNFLSIQFASKSYYTVCFTLNFIQLTITAFIGFSLQSWIFNYKLHPASPFVCKIDKCVVFGFQNSGESQLKWIKMTNVLILFPIQQNVNVRTHVIWCYVF